MKKQMRRALALLLGLMMVLSMVACGGNDTADNKADDKANTSTTEKTENKKEETKTEEKKEEVKEVRTEVNLVNEEIVNILDIMQTNKTFTRTVLVQIYEGLTFDNQDGTWDYLLAEEITPSEDGMTYTVKLKKGVKFHNGEEMQANDVVFSLTRALTMPYLAAYCGSIESAEVIDDYTVQINMKAVYAPMMIDLSFLPIVHEETVKEAGDEKMATEIVLCATGPYYMTEVDDTHIVLKAFEDYHRGAAQIKTVNYKIITDASTRLIAFEGGELDVLNVPTANWNAVESSGKYGTVIIPANHYSFMECNLYGKYTSNKLIRQAIAHAIDIEGVNLMGYDGLAVTCNRIACPDMVGGAPAESLTYEYDVEKAKAYLAEAGYPDGLDIGEIICIGGGYYEKMAVAVQAYLEAVGIHATVTPYDSATCGNKCRGNDYELAVTGHPLTADYNFLREKWHSGSNTATHNDFNDPKIDELFDKGAAELDPDKRAEIYAELDQYLMEYYINIPMFHKTFCWAYDPDLTFSAGCNNYYVYDWQWN